MIARPVNDLLSPDDLEAALRRIGAQRYHNLHPFHRALHGGAVAQLGERTIRACAGFGASASSTTTARAPPTAGSSAGCG